MWKRATRLFRSERAAGEVDRDELEDSYRKQVQLLQNVRRGVADVATSRKRVELQITQLGQQGQQLQVQAQAALDDGNENAAREILTRKVGLEKMAAELTDQYTALRGEEDKLSASAHKLQAQVEAFRNKKDTLTARYAAAEAQTQIQGAFTGVAAEVSEVGLAMKRTEDQARAMEAKAGAIEELVAEGILDDGTAASKSESFDRQFDALSAQTDVEAQLEELQADPSRSEEKGTIEGDDRG
ncbi:MAG: phage shock protein PspA [Nocardioidaceae bacterium]|nr:phage shock protein PspA [Nocardioidaceae bacterium]